MKTYLTIFALIFSLNLFAVEVDVISAEYGVEDHFQRKTLCLTVIRIPQSGELIGLVENIEDCYYARKANHSPQHKLQIDMRDLKPFTMTELLQHLQTLDTQLKFLFSEGE